MPAEPEQKALYQTYAANQWRMFMWILVDELQTTPSVWNPTILLGKIKKAELFLTLPEATAATAAPATARTATAEQAIFPPSAARRARCSATILSPIHWTPRPTSPRTSAPAG
jgi:hypothetical protein